MAQQQESPIYWDQSATRWNLTLIFSVVVAVIGIFMGPLLIILGLGMAMYSWLTTPRQFLLYRDSMVIVYGMPRTRVISFSDISHVELLALPLGERLRVRMISGGRVMLMMRDPGTFRGHLEDALSRYHGEQSGTSYVEGAVLDIGEDPDYYERPEIESEIMVEPEAGTEYEEEYESDYEPAEAAAADDATGTSGSYTEVEVEEEPEPAATETYTGYTQEASRDSGSYTEAAEPDFSGEGRPAFGADVEFETSSSEDEDSQERPRSPY